MQLAKTVLDGGHLCPLPLAVRPIYWDFDHSLQLPAVPDVLILADRGKPSLLSYAGCHCIGPGSFTQGAFAVYRPSSRQVELCQVSALQ